MTPLLAVEGLQVRYGGVTAVSDASLEIGLGEVRVILGANGAGKSTIIKSILGLLKPSAGRILFEDAHDLARMRPHEIHRLGIAWVPEGRQLWNTLTVEENLRMGAFAEARDAEVVRRIDSMYERFPKLRERRRQLAGSLSGGEQQMVAIARALVSNPKLLLMDEPSLGLAPFVVRDLFRLIVELNAAGLTILMVEQNAQQSLAVAYWAYLLETGTVVESALAAELASRETVRDVFLGGHARPRPVSAEK